MDKMPENFVTLRELFYQGRMLAVPTHQAELDRLESEVAFSTNKLELRELKFQNFPQLLRDEAQLGM